MKTIIIGYSGSGKSTLAKTISDIEKTDVLHLDKVYWLPGWKKRDKSESIEIVGNFLNTRNDWVIDGNYFGFLYERRLEEADKVIFMKFNRFSCLVRVIKRLKKYKGISRDSMTEGCNEKIDFEFLKWVLYEGRSRKIRKRYAHVTKEYGYKVITIKNQRQLENYYTCLKNNL